MACRHASLTTTFLYFLCAFSCVVWLWRPRNQLQFWMQFPAPGAARGSFVCGVFIGIAQSNNFNFFCIFLRRVFLYIFSKSRFRDVFLTFPVFFVWRLYRPPYKTRFFAFFDETCASAKKVECRVVIALLHVFGCGAKTRFFLLCWCGAVIGPSQRRLF